MLWWRSALNGKNCRFYLCRYMFVFRLLRLCLKYYLWFLVNRVYWMLQSAVVWDGQSPLSEAIQGEALRIFLWVIIHVSYYSSNGKVLSETKTHWAADPRLSSLCQLVANKTNSPSKRRLLSLKIYYYWLHRCKQSMNLYKKKSGISFKDSSLPLQW